MNEPRRLKLLAIPRDYLLPILLGRYKVYLRGLPDDVKLSEVHYSFHSQSFLVLAESAEFEPVEPMDQIPEMPMKFLDVGPGLEFREIGPGKMPTPSEPAEAAGQKLHDQTWGPLR